MGDTFGLKRAKRLLGGAVNTGLDAASAVGKVDIPLVGRDVGDVWDAANYPLLKPLAEEAEKHGAVGRIAGAGLRQVTPLTVGGAFLGGEGLAANILGKGGLSLPKYGAMLGASGLASGAGKELGGTPGEVLGGLAGSWGSLSAMGNMETNRLRTAARALEEAKNQEVPHAGALADMFQSGDRYKITTLEDGSPARVINRERLAQHITEREAHSTKGELFGNNPELTEFNTNTDILRDLHDYMTKTGLDDLPMVDAYDTGRALGMYRGAAADRAKWTASFTEAQRRDLAIKDALGSMPNYHFVDQGAQTMDSMFRENLDPDAEAALTRFQGLQAQVQTSSEKLTEETNRLNAAKAVRKINFGKILEQMPPGTRTMGRDYLKALVGGNSDEIQAAGERIVNWKGRATVPVAIRRDAAATANYKRGPLAQKFEEDLVPQFNDALAEHQGVMGQEADFNVLKMSHQGLTGNMQQEQKGFGKAISDAYGSAATALGRKLLQPEGSRSMYRSAGLTRLEDGSIAVQLERVKPATDAQSAIEAGAGLEQGHAQELAAAQQNHANLLAQRRDAARGTPERADLQLKINEARIKLDELKPSTPISVKDLPHDPDRLIVGVKDMQKFQVWEPAAKTSATALGDVRSAQTVAMLNNQTKLKLDIDGLQSQLDRTASLADSLRNKVDLTDSEKELLQQGITDGVRPDQINLLMEQSRAEEQQAILQSQLDAKMTEAGGLDDQVLRSQQTLQATSADAEQQMLYAKEQLDRSTAAADEHWSHFQDSLTLPTEGVARARSEQFREMHDMFLKNIQGELGTKRLSQNAFNAIQDEINQFSDRVRQTFTKGHQEAYGKDVKDMSKMMPNMGDQAAWMQMAAPFSGAVMHLDPGAMRSGIAGFVRRVITGTGFKTPEFEGVMTTALNGEQSAGQAADFLYHGYKLKAGGLVDKILEGAAADPAHPMSAIAQNIKSIRTLQGRLQGYVGALAHPLEGQQWQAAFRPTRQYNIADRELADIYENLRSNYGFMAENQNLFNMKAGEKVFTPTSMEYGKAVKGLRAASKAPDTMVSQLVKPEFRDYYTPRRMQPPLGAEEGAIAQDVKDRSMITDMLALKRNAEQSLGRPVQLSEMLIPKEDWERTTAANLLRRMSNQNTYKAFADHLKDPTQVGKLERGEPVSAAEWKKTEYADDWNKAKEMLQGAQGPFSAVQTASKYMQRVASTVLLGDLGFFAIQMPLAVALHPVTGGRAALEAVKTSISDEGFHAWAIDNWDKLAYRTSKGMGVGHESIFGQPGSDNLFQMVPGALGGKFVKKALGDPIQRLDNFTFGRMQLMNKMKYIDTLEHDVGLLKALGKETGQAYVDGIPAFSQLHKETDLWQSTNEELEGAFIRLANNAVGGVPRSQTLLGARRQAVENTLLMVPGFFRARAGLINQVSRALTNPRSPEGYLAASIITREAAFRLTLAAGVAAASGSLPEFQQEVMSGAAFDPRQSGGSLKGPLGDGGYLGFSWGNAAPKLYAQMLLGFKSGDFNLNPADRAKAVTAFFQGRENPAISGVIDQLQGKDFFGRPMRSMDQRAVGIMSSVLPAWVGAGMQQVEQDVRKDGSVDPKALLAQTGAQFVGLNYRAALPYDTLNNQFKAWQMDKFPDKQPLDWSQAPSDFKRMAKEQVKGLSKSEDDWIYDQNQRASGDKVQANSAFKQYTEQNHEYDGKVAEATARVNAGQMDLAAWRENYASVQEDKADSSDYLAKRMAALGIDLNKSAAKKGEAVGGANPMVAQALLAYRKVRPQDYLRADTKNTDDGPVLDQDIDWTKFKQARQEALGKFPPEVQQEVQQTIEPTDPIAQRLTQARGDMDTYFDKMPKYKGLDLQSGKYVDFVISSLRKIDSQMTSMGVTGADQGQLYKIGMKQLQDSGFIDTSEKQQLAALGFRMALDPTFQLQAREPAGIQWIVDHPDMVRFYPWLASEVPKKLQRLLPPDTHQVDLQSIANRKL